MLKIRRPLGRLIFNMGIAIPGKTVFLIETAPRCQKGNTDWFSIGLLGIDISRNKLQWNLNQNTNIFIQENTLKMFANHQPFCSGIIVFHNSSTDMNWRDTVHYRSTWWLQMACHLISKNIPLCKNMNTECTMILQEISWAAFCQVSSSAVTLSKYNISGH